MASSEWVALLILAACLLLNAVSWLFLRRQLRIRGTQRAQLACEIAELRREAAKYNTPSTFARSAKCQRQVHAKEKQLAGLQAGTDCPEGPWPARVQAAARVVKIVGAVACTLYCWGRPVLHLPPELLFPMHRFLSLPHGQEFSKYGAVAVLPWMMVCDRVGNMLVQAVLPPARISAPAAAEGPTRGVLASSGEQSEAKKEL